MAWEILRGGFGGAFCGVWGVYRVAFVRIGMVCDGLGWISGLWGSSGVAVGLRRMVFAGVVWGGECFLVVLVVGFGFWTYYW